MYKEVFMTDKSSSEAEMISPNKPITYEVQNKTFLVEPVFLQEGKDTLVNILLRLMKSDVTES